MYLVQAVSSNPRPWSSYSNIYGKDVRRQTIMYSTEDIARYSETKDQYCSPTLSRRTASSYELPEKSPKKDKKWSLGSLFRRKKKEESESSSDEEVQKKNFLGRRKRKSDKRKKPKPLGTFDHVVIPPAYRGSNTLSNGYRVQEDTSGIFSDPTNGFHGRALPKVPSQSNETVNKANSKESLECSDIHNSRVSLGSGSVESFKRNRRGLALARAAEKRSDKYDSSSDEDSQRSASSSTRFRSDENLGRQRDGSLSRRSRAARTERYIKRLSRDEENPYRDQSRAYKSDAEYNHNHVNRWKVNNSPNRSPNFKAKLNHVGQQQNFTGLSTIPPSHGNLKYKVSNSTSNASYKPPQSLNDYNNSFIKKIETKPGAVGDYFNNQRSVSCDNNIHTSVYPENEVLHVQLPIRKANLTPRSSNSLELAYDRNRCVQRQPPPPPPRDPKRLMTVQYFDNGRPMSYCFEKACQQKKNLQSFKSSSFNENTKKPTELQTNIYGRSTSEDPLPLDHFQNMSFPPRPSSVTPEASRQQRFIKRHPDGPENYQYLTDKKPRSRKPIVVQNVCSPPNQIKKPIEFWKQKDKESQEKISSVPGSPKMFTSQTHVRTKVFLPSVLNTDVNTQAAPLVERVRESSPFKPISPSLNGSKMSLVSDASKSTAKGSQEDQNEKDNIIAKHKSANLEEALDELEAIYNSLRLGDEDLLERAEQREMSAAAEKMIKNKSDVYPSWGMSRGAISDSNFNYEPFDTVDYPKRKRLLKKSKTCDRSGDDMAFRKMNKERSNTISDPQSVVSKVSYLLASPVFGNSSEDINGSKNDDEPDITLDDVVYRSIKHSNNTLKVVDPQPPFGIPIGPVTPAANSDYLHAVPDNEPCLTKPGKIPDIVKDDLAFRNLRKDSNKEPALPPLMAEDFANNNSFHNCLKKRRAMRSLSANIFNLMQQHECMPKDRNDNSVQKETDTKQSLTDIADAMEIARQVLKEKEEKINATRRAFMSDTETKYGRNDKCSPTESRLNFLNEMKSGNVQQKVQVSVPIVGDKFLHVKPHFGSVDVKPPRSPTKESTPIPLSPLEEKLLQNNNTTRSSFDDLLTALAVEARETSERITNELKQLGEERDRKSENQTPRLDLNQKPRIESNQNPRIDTNQTSRLDLNQSPKLDLNQTPRLDLKQTPRVDLNQITRFDLNQTPTTDLNQTPRLDLNQKPMSHLNQKLDDIDAVSEHAKLCEKLLECVVDSTELMASSKSDSPPVEEVQQMDLVLEKSVANEVQVRTDGCDAEIIIHPAKTEEIFSESEHDYENMNSDIEDISRIPFIEDDLESEGITSKSPFEEHKAELIATFQELAQVDDSTTPPLNKSEIEQNMESSNNSSEELSLGVNEGSEALGEGRVLDSRAKPNDSTKECAFLSESSINITDEGLIASFVSNCDIIVNNHKNHDGDKSEPHQIVYESTCCIANEIKPTNSLTAWQTSSSNLVDSLKSPKLVLESTKITDMVVFKNEGCSDDRSGDRISNCLDFNNKVDENRSSVPETFKLNNNNDLSLSFPSPRSSLPISRDSRHTLDNESKETSAWYCDPAVVIACSYGIACVHQLASMDFIAVLGLLFALVSFVAAFLLEI